LFALWASLFVTQPTHICKKICKSTRILTLFRLADKSKKINVSLVISIQAGTAVLISSSIIKLFGMGSLWSSLNQGDLIVGALNFATMFCSNYSIKFVNYPFMVLAKSAKVLPVVLTGWLLSVYKISVT